MEKNSKKRRGGYSYRKERFNQTREVQKINFINLGINDKLTQLVEKQDDKLTQSIQEQELRACYEAIFEGKTVRTVASKYFMTHNYLQERLNKIYNGEDPLVDKRRGNGKITSDDKEKLKRLIAKQPFKASETIPFLKGKNSTYSYFNWTNSMVKVLLNNLLKKRKITVTTRTCTELMNELQPTKEEIANKIRRVGKDNIWLFLNLKICEKQVMTNRKRLRDFEKTSKERELLKTRAGLENVVKYFLCIAYCFGTKKTEYKIFSTRSKYADFVDNVFTSHITQKSVIFFAENSNASTRDKNGLAFCQHRKKIEMVIHANIPNSIYERYSTVKKKGEGADATYEFDNVYEWFEKNLPYYIEDSDTDILEGFENDELQLEEMFSDYSIALFSTLRRVQVSVDNMPNNLPSETVRMEIEKRFRQFQNRKEKH